MKPEKIIIGHEKRWAALARAFARGKVPQTLLISGPAQVGKWTLALRYAQLLLCPHPQQVESPTGEVLPASCGHCRICHQVEIETFPDFVVFRPIISSSADERDWVRAPEALEGSIISIHMARKFGNEALTKPLVGQRKVMLINQADRMTLDAQNALLKTFEEPVRSLSIILLSDNPSGLLPTVYSRCWHLPLGLVSDTQIASWLPGNGLEEAPLQPEWIEEAVRVGAGRPGAAYRELRRLQRLAVSGSEEHKVSDGKSSKGKKSPVKGPDNAAAAAISRFATATEIVDRITRAQPVGALGLTEEALRLARLWWAEDQEEATREAKDLKKADAKVQRSAVARFLDELSKAYRARWVSSIDRASVRPRTSANEEYSPYGPTPSVESLWANGLDQIRKTRHYILHNVNTNLALDVMFGQLIALHREQGGTTLKSGASNGTNPAIRWNR